MPVGRSFFIIPLCLSFVVFTQSAPWSVQSTEVIYGGASVEWPSPVPGAALDLTVSGPQGLHFKQANVANWPSFSLVDEEGQPRPDGVYKWELVIQADWESTSQPTRSGWFRIQRGRVVAEGSGEREAAVVEDHAPENSLYVDQEGRVGIGTSVPGARLHVKGADAGLAIEDTQAGGREYRVRSQEKGSLGLFDERAGKARWLVDGEGRMGINTTEPTSTLTVDGYIETTKGFLVNGRPLGGFGLLGSAAQPLMTEGSSNNFFGTGAGAVNTGSDNSFFGAGSGGKNTNGGTNSFFGKDAGASNTNGSGNSFFGSGAGYSASTVWISSNSYIAPLWNSFFGFGAGSSSTSGQSNSFFGAGSGSGNTTGAQNAFFGYAAGSSNTVEPFNTLIGPYANMNPGSPGSVTNATAIGYRAYVAQANSLVLGGVRGFNFALEETFVGIGTTTPDRQLVVEGSQAIGKFRRYNELTPSHAGALLFERARGTNTAPLDILPGDYLGKVQFRGRVGGNMPEYGGLTFIAADTNQNGRFSFVDRDLVTERMVILNTGNVGIGTNAPTERLDVVGNLRVRGGILYGAPAVPVPDFVFEPDYKLMPLCELEEYVKTEKHLPAIPKAGEIEDNGVNLGEFQMKLLEKVEELTLYAVQQARVIERQKEEAAAEKVQAAAEVSGLKERVRALEEMVKTLVQTR